MIHNIRRRAAGPDPPNLADSTDRNRNRGAKGDPYPVNETAIIPKPGRYSAEDLRHLLDSGRYTDVDRLIPSLANSRAQAFRWCLQSLDALGKLDQAEKRTLAETRLQALDDVDRALADKVASLAESSNWANALNAEALSRVLILETTVKALEARFEQETSDQEARGQLIYKLLDRLHGTAEIDRLTSEIEGEKDGKRL